MWLERTQDRPELVSAVVASMREWDRLEVFATRVDDSDESLVDDIMACGPISWVAGAERPIAIFGCAPMWHGVWSMWLMATDDFNKIGISVTRLIVRTIVPMMVEAGAHRLEARSMEGHTDAHRWLGLIGAKREATHKGYGRDGEDFHTYTWPCATGAS